MNTKLVFCSPAERVGEYSSTHFGNFLPRVDNIVTLNSKKYKIKLIEYCPHIEKIYFYVIETNINQCRESVFGGARPI